MRKNKLKFAAIALLSAFALTACSDDIIAKPTGYDDDSPVVNIDGFTGTVYNNDFTDIYDSIRSGNLPSDVLDQLLYQYSMSVFGNYNKVTLAKVSNNPYGEVTLKEAVASLDGDKAAAKTFIKAHSAYWNKDKNGNRIDDTFTNQLTADDDPTDSEYARLKNKWNTIEKRIAQKLYSEISGGTYSEENVFEEIKYLRSLANSIENNVIAINDQVKQDAFKGVLTSKVEDYDVFNVQSEDIYGNGNFILHRNFYQSTAAKTEANTNAETEDATYVEDKIIPDIYRQLLVEQYLLDKSYDTLGRTSARHIDVLSISKSSDYARGANDLMNTFVTDYIFDNTRTEDIDLDTFKMVSNAWIGAFMDNPYMVDYIAADEAGRADFDENKIDKDAQAEYDLMEKALPAEYLYNEVGEKPYFKGTAYGNMREEIAKINNNPKISENESTYTGSNSYTVEIGTQIKTRELQLQDHTSTGWYIKSVGVSSLPSSLTNQLFDINISNAVGFGEKCVEYRYNATDTKWETNENDEGIKQGSLINAVGRIKLPGVDYENGGKYQYFLRNTSRIKGNPVENDILFESDNTYYIVLVRDAIRSKSLDKKNFGGNDVDQLLEYIDEIVQIVAKNDTYKNLSKKHWLEEMNIKYHDTEVYNYFKTNFPDLFD